MSIPTKRALPIVVKKENKALQNDIISQKRKEFAHLRTITFGLPSHKVMAIEA